MTKIVATELKPGDRIMHGGQACTVDSVTVREGGEIEIIVMIPQRMLAFPDYTIEIAD